jgi:hypothetical protein
MKKFGAILLSFLFVGLRPMLVSRDSLLLADVAGCCKQRRTTTSAWYRNGLPFIDCQRLKRSLDNSDQIFDDGGLVWWDQRCS